MIIPVAIILLFVSTSLGAQRSHHYSIDYSLGLSSTNIGPQTFKDAIASSVFAKIEFPTTKSLRYTIGAGYHQSQFIFYDHTGNQPFRDEERHYYIKSLVIPAGAKFYFRSFSIHPEVGAAFNFNILYKSYIIDADGMRVDRLNPVTLIKDQFDINFSGWLALGYEFNLSELIVLTGVRTYYIFVPGFLDTFGMELLVGFKI